jgi:hypothetical protein
MRLIKRKKVNAEERRRILSEIREILQREEPVIFAYLYGSFARENEFNDIDVAVYFDESSFPDRYKLFDYSLRLATEVDLGISGYEVDLHPLNLASLSFKFWVITDGELIFNKSIGRLIEFQTKTRDIYFDFFPHRQFYYHKIVLGE